MILDVEGSMAESHMERQDLGNVYIPSNIHPHVYVTLIFDNNDISEETLTGKGTTHVTNGNIVQWLAHYVPNKPPNTAPCNY